MLNLGLESYRCSAPRVSNESILAAELQYRAAKHNLDDALTALNNVSEVSRLSRRYPSYECQQMLQEMVGTESFWQTTKYYAARVWHTIVMFIKKWWTEAKRLVGKLFSKDLEQPLHLNTYSARQIMSMMSYCVRALDMADRAMADPTTKAKAFKSKLKDLKKAIKDIRRHPQTFTTKSDLLVYRDLVEQVRSIDDRAKALDDAIKNEKDYMNAMTKDFNYREKGDTRVSNTNKFNYHTGYNEEDFDERKTANALTDIVNELAKIVNELLTKAMTSIKEVTGKIATMSEFKSEQNDYMWSKRGMGDNADHTSITDRPEYDITGSPVQAIIEEKDWKKMPKRTLPKPRRRP